MGLGCYDYILLLLSRFLSWQTQQTQMLWFWKSLLHPFLRKTSLASQDLIIIVHLGKFQRGLMFKFPMLRMSSFGEIILHLSIPIPVMQLFQPKMVKSPSLHLSMMMNGNWLMINNLSQIYISKYHQFLNLFLYVSL